MKWPTSQRCPPSVRVPKQAPHEIQESSARSLRRTRLDIGFCQLQVKTIPFFLLATLPPREAIVMPLCFARRRKVTDDKMLDSSHDSSLTFAINTDHDFPGRHRWLSLIMTESRPSLCSRVLAPNALDLSNKDYRRNRFVCLCDVAYFWCQAAAARRHGASNPVSH